MFEKVLSTSLYCTKTEKKAQSLKQKLFIIVLKLCISFIRNRHFNGSKETSPRSSEPSREFDVQR